MTLFTVTVFVLFHFGLDRDSLDGELASGVLWVTLLLAAVIGVTRLFAAEREQGGIDALLLAPVDRTALFVAKARGAVPLPRGARAGGRAGLRRCCCWARTCCGALPELLLVLLLADVGLAAVGALVAALGVGDPRARADRAAAAAPAAGAAADRARRRPPSRCCAATVAGGPRPLAGRCSPSTTRCSCCSPGRVRLPAGGLDVRKGASSRSLSPPWSPPRWRSRWCSSTRRSTPTRASSRRSSTCTCRWRSWRSAASWPAGSWPSSTCAPATARGTCARTWPSTCRSSSAWAC